MATPSPAHPHADLCAQFVAAVTRTKSVTAVGDGRRLASLPAPSDGVTPLFLLWSHGPEAVRWADVLATAPQILEIDVVTLLAETLPAIRAAEGRIGPDWSAEPLEPEMSVADLDHDLRAALVADWAASVIATRGAWVLHDSETIVGVDVDAAGVETIPLWSDRMMAEYAARRVMGDALPRRLSLADLVGSFLMSPRGLKARLAPAYVQGPGAIRMTPWQLKALLATGGKPGASRVA